MSAGIRNLRLQMNINGVNTDFVLNNVYFRSDPLLNCSESLSQKAADAINQTIVSAATRISNGDLPSTTNGLNGPIPPDPRFIVFVELSRNFRAEIQDCAPANSTRFSEVSLPDNGQVQVFQNTQNAIFTDFSTAFQTTCN